MTPQDTDPDLSVSVQEYPKEAWVSGGLLQGRGHWVWHCMHGTFWRRSPLSSLSPPQFGLRSNKMEGTQAHPSAESWIKDLLLMALPIWTSPSFPHSQSLPSGNFCKLLILLYQRAGRMKATITENKLNWSDGPQPCLTQGNYQLSCVEPPKMDGSWWKVLLKRYPLEKAMANHFSILALTNPWIVWKGKKIGHWKINSSGQYMPNILLEKSGEITPERMERQSQSNNNAQLWMWVVMEVKSNAVRAILHSNLEC